MRLIDADALIESIAHADCVGGWNPIIQLIHYAPTIEAVPVRHGHWISEGYCIKKGEGIFKAFMCEKCGAHTLEDSNYCPNCGAKMLEEEPDNFDDE